MKIKNREKHQYRALNPLETKKARKHIHYKVAMMVAQHFGRDMGAKEIAMKLNCRPTLVGGIAGFLRKNGVDIPQGIYTPRCPARFVALEDIKKAAKQAK